MKLFLSVFAVVCVFCLSSCTYSGGANSDLLDDLEVNINYSGVVDLTPCQQEQIEIGIKCQDRINEVQEVAEANATAIQEEYDLFAEQYMKSYQDFHIEIKNVFELEGGDLVVLENEIQLLEDLHGTKVDELVKLIADVDSQEWRDEARILDVELEEGIQELYSTQGGNTEKLVVDFLAWFKENKPNLDELEDEMISTYSTEAIDEEIELLRAEQDEAIAALNCS